MKNDSKIKNLTKKLRYLQLGEKKIQQQVQEIQQEIVHLEETGNLSKEEEEQRKTSSLTRVPRKSSSRLSAELNSPKIFRDRNGTVLKVRDKVKFLTASKFCSTEGKVKYFTAFCVTVEDHRGIKISKTAHDLLIVDE